MNILKPQKALFNGIKVAKFNDTVNEFKEDNIEQFKFENEDISIFFKLVLKNCA